MADPSVGVSVSSQVDGDKPTRASLGKASSPMSGGMILPRYLQPSSGSCHDSCKYGKHHEFEKKSWLQSQRRGMKTPGAKHFSEEFPEEMKKKADNKLKHQPDSKTHVLDTTEIIKREVLTTSVNKEGSRLNHKKMSEGTLTKADGSHSSVKRVTAKKKTRLQQLNLFESKSSVSSGVVHHERKNLSIHGKKRGPSDKCRTSPGLKSGLSSPFRKQNTSATSDKFRVFSELASLRLGVDLSPKQTISSKQISSSVDALELSSGGRISHVKMGPRTGMPRIMVKKGHASPNGSFSPMRSSSRVSRKVTTRTSNNGVTRGFSSPGASLPPKVSPSRVARGFLSPRNSLTSKVSHGSNASLNAKKDGGPKVNSPTKILNKIETDGKANADRPDRKIVDPGHSISALKEPNNDMVQEKTLYVIKMETESNYVNSDVNEKVSMESSPPLSSASRRACSPRNSPSLPVHNCQDDDESEVRGQFVPQESMEMTPSTLILDINTPGSENPSAEAKVEENSDYDKSECAEDAKVSMESSPPSSVSPRASCLPNCPSWPVHNNQDDDESENSSIEEKEEASSDYDESECSEYEKVSMESCPPPSLAPLRASSLPNSPSLPVLNDQDNEESENSSTEAKEETNSDYDESKCAKCEKVPMESFPPSLSASPRASSPPSSPSFPVHNSQDNDESEKSSTGANEEENSDYDESDCAEDERVSLESSPPSSSSPRASSLPNSPSLPVHNNHDDDESENPSAEAEEEENSDYDESECAEDEKVSMESSPPPASASPRASSPPNSPSLPVHNDQDNDKSENLSTEAKGQANSGYDESKRAKDAVALKGAHRGRQKKGRLVLSEDKDCPPVKLRFRRGKVVDLLSESRSPRRLKFRRGKVLGEDKILKNHDKINFKTEADGKANDHHESVKVVLRHQNVHRKKNARLFNNVIEETASKLVETRKSKVKALVGAFETVICLQDSKPSSNMVP